MPKDCFIEVSNRSDVWDTTINCSAIMAVTKSNHDGEGCTIKLIDGSQVLTADSKRTVDAKIRIATNR